MRLKAVGAYLPRLDPARIRLFVEQQAETFLEGVRSLQLRGLTRNWTEPSMLERAAEISEELGNDLQHAVLFELEVWLEAGESFDPYAVHQLAPAGMLDSGYVAWEPAFLSADGEQAQDALDSVHFRVAFYIHEWPEASLLRGPTGVLDLPEFAPLPERLWRLAPYALLD